ncbi:DUF2642 domain-containing protein [Metabacillus sp. KUDC1714]|uniref:DUF2642 domain-containing protein n=2 Tax=Metabacillus TaxID=2675233 RepID=A0A179SNJ4_9BACI|nr:hypothetical protein A6K24_10410 [Metabacillus litoralis]QNF27585.1 DUF2642 domain-containing protein [Metabacillus sp. KUDC1714]
MLAFRGAGDEPPQREAPAGSHLSRYSHRSLAPSAPITLISFVQKQQSFRKEPNKKIKVVLVNGSLEGMLTGVAIDHLQLTIDGENYYVRYPQVVYFKKAG